MEGASVHPSVREESHVHEGTEPPALADGFADDRRWVRAELGDGLAGDGG